MPWPFLPLISRVPVPKEDGISAQGTRVYFYPWAMLRIRTTFVRIRIRLRDPDPKKEDFFFLIPVPNFSFFLNPFIYFLKVNFTKKYLPVLYLFKLLDLIFDNFFGRLRIRPDPDAQHCPWARWWWWWPTLFLGEGSALVVEAVVDPDPAAGPDIRQGLQHHVPYTVGSLTQAPTHIHTYRILKT